MQRLRPTLLRPFSTSIAQPGRNFTQTRRRALIKHQAESLAYFLARTVKQDRKGISFRCGPHNFPVHRLSGTLSG